MPLTLVTGPANADKAGVVLGRARELAGRGEEPILVVPAREDVTAYRAELAAGAVLIGLRIEQFNGLMEEVRLRAGLRARGAGEVTREQVARTAVAGLRLGPMAASARTQGFAPALAKLAAELARLGVGTARFGDAMRRWAAAEPGRGAYAADLAAVVVAYRDGLQRLGRSEPADADRAALDVLRREPRRWEGTPVLLYGFDDFTAVQLDAIETLAVHAGAEVVVSLPFEAGREAFAARQGVYAALAAFAGPDGVTQLPASDAAYDPGARPALHHLERTLFTSGDARVEPGDAIELLEGGGERAELELVAERVRRLLADETPADEIVLAVRDLQSAAPLVETILREAGIPFALEREVGLSHTALGAGVLGLLRGALPGGSAGDLLRFLRTPGFVKRAGLVDELERVLRVRGVTSAAAAQEAWAAQGGFPLDAVARVERAAGRGTAELCDRLATEAARLLSEPQRALGADHAAGRVLTAEEALDAAALAHLLAALRELGRLAVDAPPLAPPVEALPSLLEDVRVPAGVPPAAGRVVVTTPFAVRARRRVDTLFLCRLQEDVFPAAARAEPFLGDDERRAVNAAAGLRLEARDDPLPGERLLFYAAASRPTRRLVLSWHAGDDDGEPRVRSPFVDDVLTRFTAPMPVRGRLLGAIRWDAGADVSTRQRAIGASAPAAGDGPPASPLGALTSAPVLERLAAQEAWSASALELWARCPVRWFAERHLAPESLDPEAEPLGRGSVVHAALEHALRVLGGPLVPANLAEAEVLVAEGLRLALRDRAVSVDPRREVAERHRIEADLLRYVAHAAHAGSVFVPRHFELTFGLPGSAHPAVDLGGGLVLRGAIDRIDVSPDGREAIVIDYKGRSGAPSWTAWADEGRLQAGLYALVLGHLLPGVEVVGALLQPIGPDDLDARGLLVEGCDAERRDVKDVDRLTREQRDEALRDVRAAALEAVRQIRAGALEPRPGSCGYKGAGCEHPSLCRCAA